MQLPGEAGGAVRDLLGSQCPVPTRLGCHCAFPARHGPGVVPSFSFASPSSVSSRAGRT
ncbi:hypothetical protein SLI_7549 [Streptomyces lividans 1326]|uniref:Uncharacterized protein n=1 Tax=Streptomyces lividans 1326 TaxID=1200984 RepID=A0A7U9E280_STRLI|nr:hypothetical protein SLI_7549 [Streptomyces lividans 1326]